MTAYRQRKAQPQASVHRKTDAPNCAGLFSDGLHSGMFVVPVMSVMPVRLPMVPVMPVIHHASAANPTGSSGCVGVGIGNAIVDATHRLAEGRPVQAVG